MLALYPNASAPNGASYQASQSTQPPADVTAPTMQGQVTLSSITTTSVHAAWQAATDNVAVTGYEVSCDTGTLVWIDVGNVLATDFSALSPSTGYTVRVRAYDAAGNKATAISQAFTTQQVNDGSTPFKATVRFLPLNRR